MKDGTDGSTRKDNCIIRQLLFVINHLVEKVHHSVAKPPLASVQKHKRLIIVGFRFVIQIVIVD